MDKTLNICERPITEVLASTARNNSYELWQSSTLIITGGMPGMEIYDEWLLSLSNLSQTKLMDATYRSAPETDD